MAAAVTTQVEYDLSVVGGPSTSAGPTTHVLEFEVREGISELYEVDVTIAHADVELDLEGLMGSDAVLSLIHEDGDRHFHGIVIEAEELDETANFTRYQLRLAPRMAMLGHTRVSRIFQDKTTPEILTEILAEAGISGPRLDDRLNDSFQPRNYCVQYRESSLGFISRLMEEEGISFWFEHSTSDHILVLADDPTDFVDIPSPTDLSFQPPGMGTPPQQHIWRFRPRQRIRAGKVTLVDYSFKQPTQEMAVSSEGSQDSDLEIYDYPGNYVDSGLGTNFAQVRHEELQVPRQVRRGDSTVLRLIPGHLFTLQDHPNGSLNVCYRTLRLRHFGRRADPAPNGDPGDPEYRNDLESMPSEIPYRPPRITRIPEVSGIQTAIVAGPSGEEIHVDEFGRVKVQFHWDRQGEYNESSSCWIRVSQAWAGSGFGHMFIPRIGQEVIVQFIEGDPNRPLITGRVYNGDNALPYSLPDNKTVSTIKSKSSKDSDGFNELRFEDKAGSEEIYLHAQRDFNERVLNCHTTDVGHDQSNTVHNNQSERVDVDQELSVGANRTVHVEGDFDETVDGTETRVVTGAVSETFQSTEDRTVVGAVTEHFSDTETRTVMGDVSETFLANETKLTQGNREDSVIGSLTTQVTGNEDATRAANVTTTVKGSVTTTVLGPVVETYNAPVTLNYNAGVTVNDSNKSCFSPYSISATGFSASITGVSMSSTGLSISNTLAAISTPSLYSKTTKLVVGNGKLHLETEVVKMGKTASYCRL
jgi:type VI secretion system secreted protein VgrG